MAQKHNSKKKLINPASPLTLDELSVMIANSFTEAQEQRQEFKQYVEERFEQIDVKLDRIEFHVSSQDRRISILEDRVRLLGTKAGLDFRTA